MRKIRFTEHQIIAVLKSFEAGRTVKDVCREAAISEASYYNWKAKYGGMEAADIKKKSKIWKTRTGGSNRCLLTSALSDGHLKTSSKKSLKTIDKA